MRASEIVVLIILDFIQLIFRLEFLELGTMAFGDGNLATVIANGITWFISIFSRPRQPCFCSKVPVRTWRAWRLFNRQLRKIARTISAWFWALA